MKGFDFVRTREICEWRIGGNKYYLRAPRNEEKRETSTVIFFHRGKDSEHAAIKCLREALEGKSNEDVMRSFLNFCREKPFDMWKNFTACIL